MFFWGFFCFADENCIGADVKKLKTDIKFLPTRAQYRTELSIKNREISNLEKKLKAKDKLLLEFQSKYAASESHNRVLKFRLKDKSTKLKGQYVLNGLTQYTAKKCEYRKTKLTV